MKISIAYTEHEAAVIPRLISAITAILPPVKIHKSEQSPPFQHVYLTTRKPKIRIESKTIG